MITIGRSSVDLYGQQIGGRLEDMGSFAKSVGGSPTNMAIGAARLGLKAGLITRVGDEQMGRFIREQLAREGVATDGVITDPQRLTALVVLGVRDDKTFPHIFYRTDCADMALSEDDIDEAYIASAGAIVVTGTHFSTATVEAASRKAMRIAKAAGRKVVFDVDYRPNLWGLAGHAAGEARYIRSEAVTERLAAVVAEMRPRRRHRGRADDRRRRGLAARRGPPPPRADRGDDRAQAGPDGLRRVSRARSRRGIEDGIRGPGFPVDVYNTLGAGDGFMAGFLRGWLRGEPIETTCAWANACGAIAVSRLLCSPEYPTFDELQFSSKHGSTHRALRHDADLNHVHWAETRRPQPERLMALAIDHRSQFEALADRLGAPRERIGRFKELAVEATARVADGRPGFGMLIDGTLRHARRSTRRPTSRSGSAGRSSSPVRARSTFEGGGDLGAHLVEWPVNHTVKCLCFYHPDDRRGAEGAAGARARCASSTPAGRSAAS